MSERTEAMPQTLQEAEAIIESLELQRNDALDDVERLRSAILQPEGASGAMLEMLLGSDPVEMLEAEREYDKDEHGYLSHRVDTLEAVLRAILVNPHGCVCCDYGVLRKPNDPAKGHDDDCEWVKAWEVLNEPTVWTEEMKKEMRGAWSDRAARFRARLSEADQLRTRLREVEEERDALQARVKGLEWEITWCSGSCKLTDDTPGVPPDQPTGEGE